MAVIKGDRFAPARRLTTKSMPSMTPMAALAPEMKAAGEYGNDKQRQQAETMALYKRHNVNPAAGCVSILLQMPIYETTASPTVLEALSRLVVSGNGWHDVDLC